MSKLFILGNGFDLQHELKTTYEDFYKYLKNSYKITDEEYLSDIPQAGTLPDGSASYDKEGVVKLLINVISAAEEEGEKWKDFENSLGKLDFDEYLDTYSDVYNEGSWKNAYLYEDKSSDLYDSVLMVKDLFSEWINSISISKCNKNSTFDSLVNLKKDFFMTFNYTHILESVYKAKNVFHIHGEQNSEIIIGHGHERENFDKKYLGAEFNLYKIHEDLRKRTHEIINQSNFFRQDISNVKEIYSYGFSFSEVDRPYLEEICKKINTESITWYLSEYEDKETRGKYEKIIKDIGFKGEFGLFNLS